MSPTCSPARRCPRASRRCRWRCAIGGSPSRPGPRPASATPWPPAPAPADVLRVASYHELPLRMRTLGPVADAHGAPRIAYPPPDARIELGSREAVPLSALGGEGRLRWLVDGRPLDGTKWVPDGPC